MGLSPAKAAAWSAARRRLKAHFSATPHGRAPRGAVCEQALRELTHKMLGRLTPQELAALAVDPDEDVPSLRAKSLAAVWGGDVPELREAVAGERS